jgi:hypothetical protein
MKGKGNTMEESGEQCSVVFALIVAEQASEFVCGRGGGVQQPPRPSPRSPVLEHYMQRRQFIVLQIPRGIHDSVTAAAIELYFFQFSDIKKL